jgi:hypothetical protein
METMHVLSSNVEAVVQRFEEEKGRPIDPMGGDLRDLLERMLSGENNDSN